jgi:hypothetical protein
MRICPSCGIALAVLLAGCAAEPPIESAIDSKGRTRSTATSMVTLASAAPRFSEAARDYLYLVPVEINETGTRRHYLWLGLATTIDRAWLGAQLNAAETLVVSFDGVPVGLPLLAWDPAPPPFATPAPTYDVRRAHVSLDQLERLATAASIEVEIVPADAARTRFAPWRGRWDDWLPFVAGIDEPNRRAAQ